MSVFLDTDEFYAPMPSRHDGVYFGYEREDYLGLSPVAWFHHHHERFLRSLDQIRGARAAYEDGAGPEGEGIYFLFDGDALQYVGQSRAIATRLVQHFYPNPPSLLIAPWLSHFSAIWAPLDLLNTVEGYYIHLLRPPRNVKYAPLSRHAKLYMS